MKLKSVITLLLCALTIGVNAQWEPVREITGQGNLFSSIQTSHAPSMICNGPRVRAVWCAINNPSKPKVYLNYSNDSGSTWNVPVLVSDSNKAAISPSIALSSNRIHVIWYDYYQTLYSYSTDTGLTWATPQIIDSANGYSYYSFASIAAHSNTILIAYTKISGNNAIAYVKKSSDEGNTWSNPVVISGSMDSVGHTSLNINGDNAYAAWYERKTKKILMRHSTDKGNTWLAPVIVASNNGVEDNFMIAIDSNNVNIPFVRTTNQGRVGGTSYSQIWIALSNNFAQSFTEVPITDVVQFSYSSWGSVSCVRDQQRVHIIGANASYFRSDNGGNNWSGKQSSFAYMYNIAITGEMLHAYGFSSNGIIYSRNMRGNRSIPTAVDNKTAAVLKVFPNPAYETIFFELPQITSGKTVAYNIHDYSGRLIYSNAGNFNQSAISVDVRGLKAGMYFYKIAGDDNLFYTGKFLVK